MMQANSLRRLLFGSPLSERAADGADPAVKHLDGVLKELVELLRSEHTDKCRAFRQAEREILDVVAFTGEDVPAQLDAAVAAKRSVLLYALWRDPEIAERFRATDAKLIDDLQSRVLPLAGPLYLANLGQRPDAFVALCDCMLTMWSGEPFRMPETAAVAFGEGSE